MAGATARAALLALALPLTLAAGLSAAGTATASDFAEAFGGLPECQTTDWESFAAHYQECGSWGVGAGSACSDGCQAAQRSLGAECAAAYINATFGMLGLNVSMPTIKAVVADAFKACQAGQPSPVDSAVVLLREAMSPFPSCAAVNWTAAAASGCTMDQMASSTGAGCPTSPACIAMLTAIGADCATDYSFTAVKHLGLLDSLGIETPAQEADLHELVHKQFEACIAPAAPGRSLKNDVGGGEEVPDSMRRTLLMAARAGVQLPLLPALPALRG